MTSDKSEKLKIEQLRGFRIGVTSERRSDDLIAALQRRGAHVLHAPALKLAPNDHDDLLINETRAVISARPDMVLVTTGYGMRRWLEVTDAAGLSAPLTAVLEEARVLARGPKALGAVRAAGLDDADMTGSETTASLVDKVLEAGATGRCVAVQQHGYTDQVQLDRLRQMGATVLTVTPYRWAAPTDDRLPKLIEAACRGQLDAITFTSAPAVQATLTTARTLGRFEDFRAALRDGVVAAAIGPVTAAPLIEAGIAPIQPERFRMGTLIRLLCDHLEAHGVSRFRAGDVDIELRGRCVHIQDNSVMLGPTALALFKKLAATGSVVSREELVSCLAEGPDDHALEVALSRLRRALGVPSLITAVVKRGYRLNAVRLD